MGFDFSERICWQLYSYLYSYYNPLAELTKCILNSAYGLTIEKIHILQNVQRTYLADDSGKQTIFFLWLCDNFGDQKQMESIRKEVMREQGQRSL